ncbi:hypothetical protein ACPYO6_16465 [Georgenia sp. Z1344]|uniref:hypothetical protein n=1 Tax=Georgenia sp. Z1344 TaxID=3416706 RepID=UPI003CF6131E
MRRLAPSFAAVVGAMMLAGCWSAPVTDGTAPPDESPSAGAPSDGSATDGSASDGSPSEGTGSDGADALDRDTFAVPTWAHSPGQMVMEALIIGDLVASPEGCPVMTGEHGYDGDGTGIMLPNAVGRRTEDGLVVEYEMEGEHHVARLDGSEQSFGGGGGTPENEAEWERVCPHTPVSDIWQGY